MFKKKGKKKLFDCEDEEKMKSDKVKQFIKITLLGQSVDIGIGLINTKSIVV